MLKLLEQLNKNQREAVMKVDTHLRLIAGAGSGKTRVITTRIAYLIKELAVFPASILAITFTNKAANEMKERINHFLGDEGAGVVVSTIHALCVKILRQDIYVLGYPRNFTIIDTDDQKAILKEAYSLYGIDVKAYSYGNVMGYISNNKTHFVGVEEAMMMAKGNQSESVKAKVYTYYQKRLEDLFALDFDDLLLKTHELLKNHPDKRSKWQSHFDYLHVDEFQDVDMIQYDIVKYLVSDQAILCVVGDPDQTIYTWRGAKVDIILNFEKDFPSAVTIYLNQNYRSTSSILQAANAVIKNNTHRLEKDLFTENQEGSKVIHYTAYEESYEPKWVVEQISQLHQHGVPYSDIAILYRSNYLSRLLEKTLVERNVPYIVYGGIRFYERAEIKDVLSYLRMLVSGDDLAFKRIINTPKRKIGVKSIEAIFEKAQEEQISMYEVIKKFAIGSKSLQNTLQRFVELIEQHRTLLEEKPASFVLEQLIQESGYLQWLEDEKEVERIENVKELLNDVIAYEKNNEQANLEEYLQIVALYTDTSTESIQEAVSLMSVHASKGLEFDYVFVYGMSDGIFPSERSMNESGLYGLEEERRLAYVAFTRARKGLYLSDAKGFNFILNRNKQTSRFINEIHPDVIEHHGAVDEIAKLQAQARVEQTLPTPTKTKLRTGDHVSHEVFGDGVIVSVKDGIATIAFSRQYGVRKLMVNHPSITKK